MIEESIALQTIKLIKLSKLGYQTSKFPEATPVYTSRYAYTTQIRPVHSAEANLPTPDPPTASNYPTC